MGQRTDPGGLGGARRRAKFGTDIEARSATGGTCHIFACARLNTRRQSEQRYFVRWIPPHAGRWKWRQSRNAYPIFMGYKISEMGPDLYGGYSQDRRAPVVASNRCVIPSGMAMPTGSPILAR